MSRPMRGVNAENRAVRLRLHPFVFKIQAGAASTVSKFSAGFPRLASTAAVAGAKGGLWRTPFFRRRVSARGEPSAVHARVLHLVQAVL